MKFIELAPGIIANLEKVTAVYILKTDNAHYALVAVLSAHTEKNTDHFLKIGEYIAHEDAIKAYEKIAEKMKKMASDRGVDYGRKTC